MNKKPFILLAATPLLLAGCGKISKVPQFLDYSEADKVTSEAFVEAFNEAQSKLRNLLDFDNPTGPSVSVYAEKQEISTTNYKNAAGQRVKTSEGGTREVSLDYETKADVTSYKDFWKLDFESNPKVTNGGTVDKSELVFQKETIRLDGEEEAKSRVLEFNLFTKEYQENSKDNPRDVAAKYFKNITEKIIEVDEDVFDNEKTSFYHKDNLFTVVLHLTKEDIDDPDVKNRTIEATNEYKIQYLYKENRAYMGVYEYTYVKRGADPFYNSFEAKQEKGQYVEIKIGEAKAERQNISKFCESAK